MTRFAAGQVVTVFRNRLREDGEPGYQDTAAEMRRIAESLPGFVDAKTFTAEDGERVTIATFADHEAQRAWATHAEHRVAQQRGRDGWYETYSIQVADCVRAHDFQVERIEHTFD